MSRKNRSSSTLLNKNRRQFLDMLGSAGISTGMLRGAPLLGGVFASRYAQAQATGKKIVFVYLTNGAPNGHWLPKSPSEMNGCTEPFASFAGDIAFREATLKVSGHGNTFNAMGAYSYTRADKDSSSLNIQMAKAIGATTPFSSIQLGVDSHAGVGVGDIISRLDGNMVPNEDDPATAFNSLFKNAPPSAGSGGDLAAQQLSVLDANKAALDALKTKLGQSEKDKLEAHFASLERIEQRIKGANESAEGACNTGAGVNMYPSQGFLGKIKSQSDNIVNAFQCGLTRVASLQISNQQAKWVGTNSGADSTQFTDDHHQACHAGATVQDNVEMVQYLNKGVAYLISELKAKGLFESTLLVTVTDMGDGQDHTAGNAPMLIASGVPGFRSGVREASSNESVFVDAIRGMDLDAFVGGDGPIFDYQKSGTGIF